jgi:hypothetical protein
MIIIRVGGIVAVRTRFYLNKIRVSDEWMDRVYNKQNGPNNRKVAAMHAESQTQ